ncbi:hypothetical protein VIGAN_04096700 [Vigna angularis var. angularis]|uniref:Uncharacterized protein n=1 Tax=Vigna angularis var. angularis TaxID=157739 RepID=A0A0S3RT55_PHAAN|nr:hypothetical protein VIGAN_04096700 [Vigna angularis var. angularis]
MLKSMQSMEWEKGKKNLWPGILVWKPALERKEHPIYRKLTNLSAHALSVLMESYSREQALRPLLKFYLLLVLACMNFYYQDKMKS